MVVQHNLTAMNANRMLGITTNQQAKSSEKLSSGYRINRAADDAAGLTISEKMRKQIRGLDQASTNAQDGVSAVQTAEGALTEVHSMLQRMNELATQASNGTNSEADRKAIQDEISQLETEIDRVAETTKFNETYLLKGDGRSTTKTVAAHDAGFAGTLSESVDGKTTFQLDALKVGDSIKIGGKDYKIADSKSAADYAKVSAQTLAAGDKIIKTDGTVMNVVDTVTDATKEVAAGAYTPTAGESIFVATTGTTTTYTAETPNDYATLEAAIKGLASGKSVTVDGTQYTVSTYSKDATNITADDILSKIKDGSTVKVDTGADVTAVGVAATKSTATNAITLNDAYTKIADELAKASSIGTDNAATVTSKGAGEFEITQGTVRIKEALSFNLHVGADADTTNKISVDIDAMSAAGLGIKGIDVNDVTGTKATYAIDAIADAIATVSSQRSALGAVQNRLEHTIANLDNVVENTTAAESRIRDTDMAEEMVEYSKNNILAQAGQSMLAQANQSTQGVLSLLQ